MIRPVIRDILYAFRQLKKAPGFSIVAIGTLAIGIGAGTAVFSVVSSVLLRPLPYREPGRIVALSSRNSDSQLLPYVTGPQLKQWRQQASRVAEVAGIWDRFPTNLLGDGRAQRITCALASANYLKVLGVQPLLGHDFAPSQDVRGNDPSVAILSHEIWKTRFGGDAAVLGRTVNLGGWKCRVIGVLPPHILPDDQLDVLMPLVLESREWQMVPDTFWLEAIARLRPDVTPAQAESELNRISRELYARILPSLADRMHTYVRPLQSALSDEVKPLLLILAAAVVVMLLIVCGNLANLLLVRASVRQKEMAVRAALGASRSQLMRLVLTESALLALIGGGAGILLAAGLVRVAGKVLGAALPALVQPTLDWRVLGFATGLSTVTALAFGLVPAWRSSRTSPGADLKDASRTLAAGARSRIQSILIVSEIALTGTLLITAGLFLRSLQRILSSDAGFDRRGVLVCDWSVTIDNFYRGSTGNWDRDQILAFDHILQFLKQVVTRIEALPGVECAGTVTTLPFGGKYWVTRAGLPDRPPTEDRSVALDYVGFRYFQAMGIRLLQGRFLDEADGVQGGPRVLAVNAAFAREFFPGKNPVGAHVRMNNAEWTVVGVVGDVRNQKMDSAAGSHVYGVQAINPVTIGFVVRTRTDPLAFSDQVRRIVAGVDADQTVANFRTLEQAVDGVLGQRTVMLYLLGAFAAIALVLACIGVYGLTAYAVAQRSREFSIRIALGASRWDVVRLVARSGFMLSGVGVALGLIGSAALSRLISAWLYDVNGVDPLVFMAVSLLLVGVATVAALVPATRATRANPMEILRGD
jgi:putative ABC transport system permease protein